MSQEEDIHILIDRYLNAELGEDERSAFESRLQTDENFAQTFEAQKVVNEMVVDHQLIGLKSQMMHDLNGAYQTFGIKNQVWRYVISGAAVVASIIIFYFLFNNPENIQENIKTESASDTIRLERDFPVVNLDTAIVDSLPVTEEKEIVTLPEEPAVVKNICVDTLISFSCQAKGACMRQNDGAIEIDVKTIKSGKAPYQFGVNRNGAFYSSPVVPNLKAGKYDLYVKGADECIRKLNARVEVPEIHCDHTK